MIFFIHIIRKKFIVLMTFRQQTHQISLNKWLKYSPVDYLALLTRSWLFYDYEHIQWFNIKVMFYFDLKFINYKYFYSLMIYQEFLFLLTFRESNRDSIQYISWIIVWFDKFIIKW